MNETAIEVKNLTRRFGDFTAVNEISFKIKYGEIFGFLGPNGAGKSTTVRILCGILAPTEGTAQVAGFDVNEDSERIKESIGYVSQRFSLYTDLTVIENLEFFGRVYQLPPEKLSRRIKEILEMASLGTFRNQMVSTLSGGWKQRLAIASALLHEPRILFLDEPTAGIDPLSRRSLWELLYQLTDNGAALFVTTHYMEEAERCNQIAFISEGKLLRIGEPNQLKSNITGKLLEVECRPLMKASNIFRKLPGVIGLTAYGTTLHINVSEPDQATRQLYEAAKDNGIEISTAKPIAASIEDVFAALEGDDDTH